MTFGARIYRSLPALLLVLIFTVFVITGCSKAGSESEKGAENAKEASNAEVQASDPGEEVKDAANEAAEEGSTGEHESESSAEGTSESEGATKGEEKSEGEAEGEGEGHGESSVPKGSTHSGGELEQERQGAHEISPEQKHEAILQVLDDFLMIEAISDPSKTEDLSSPLAKQALTSAEETMKNDQKLGRVKHRKFQDIKLKFRNYTGGVSGVAVEYTDLSFYSEAKTGEILIPVKPTIQRYSVAAQKLDGRWKIVMFLEPPRKPPAEDIKESTTTLPEAVEKVQEETGYN